MHRIKQDLGTILVSKSDDHSSSSLSNSRLTQRHIHFHTSKRAANRRSIGGHIEHR
jgi:hypothetical protein